MRRSRAHIIVLAAGLGNRLGKLSAETPKWLLALRDTTIARCQLDAVRRVAESEPGLIASVRVVTGHASQAIERFLAEETMVTVEAIHNPEYATLNNWYSLLVGLRSLDPERDASVVVFNADLFAPAAWMAQFVMDSVRSPADAMIAVDLERALTDEAMKISTHRAELSSYSEPHLTGIGKAGINDPIGEYVGMLMARGPVLTQLRETLESYVGHEDLSTAWYVHAIGQCADDGASWSIWPTPESTWVEIDDDADYTVALELVDAYASPLRQPA